MDDHDHYSVARTRPHQAASAEDAATGAEARAAPGKRAVTDRLVVQRRAMAPAVPATDASHGAPTSQASPVDGDIWDILSGQQASGASSAAAPVQRQPATAMTADEPQAIAAAATAGPGGPLPHADTIQQAFGPHDVSGIRAHTDAAAATGSAQLGAHAFATGNDIAFASPVPDLHTAAHEAAHVVQQRAGVHLKDGLGQTGDAYEQHADAVADAVVRGESAANLLGPVASGGTPGVQRQADGASASPTPVAVTVTWSTPFGSDLTGEVALFGRNRARDAWTPIATLPVAAGHSITFTSATRYAHYRATVQPEDDRKSQNDATDGPFDDTDLDSRPVAATATAATIRGQLNLNRWNPDNVRQRHAAERIDPDKAKRLVTKPLFGRVVNVHRLLADRVARTNALYEALPQETKDEITRNLFVTGGYAYRNITGKQGGFTNHSIGAAIDINYNEGKLQNALMETPEEKDLLRSLVQPVVNLAPGFEGFQIFGGRPQDKGQRQLAAAKAFVETFPTYLAGLLGRDDDVAAINRAIDNPYTALGGRDPVGTMFHQVSVDELRRAAAGQRDAGRKHQLELLAENWSSVKAWVVGAEVVDKHAGQKDERGRDLPDEQKTAATMIPLDQRVLQMMLDTGWKWGGDWTDRKDYMHFEDESFKSELQLEDGDAHH